MPRKDRSSSWSGRPLWMEVAEATRIKVIITFFLILFCFYRYHTLFRCTVINDQPFVNIVKNY